jgi:hypothetical protein
MRRNIQKGKRMAFCFLRGIHKILFTLHRSLFKGIVSRTFDILVLLLVPLESLKFSRLSPFIIFGNYSIFDFMSNNRIFDVTQLIFVKPQNC